MAVIAFVSTMEDDPWGASEELWAQAAVELVRRGHTVRASVAESRPVHPRVVALRAAGVDVALRQRTVPLWTAGWRKLVHRGRAWGTLIDLDHFLSAGPAPDLVVISEGGMFPWTETLARVAGAGPYVVVSHGNAVHFWPSDDVSDRLRPLLAGARRWYFVSEANRMLAETQLGVSIHNASIVRNPCNVDRDVALPWPAQPPVRFACVGRLDPRSKGHDLLLGALDDARWADREWELHIYGDGPMRRNVERLVARCAHADRITMHGHVDSVVDIWRTAHALVQPSRHEGLPLTVVEAMMCRRPVVATGVAGHPEVVTDGVSGFIAEAPTVAAVGAALDRAWHARDRLEQMGADGGRAIRALVPPGPAERFADELLGHLP